ncbi:glycosyltransferase [Candidatus Parcubacteria bacterium]|nr:MAG: glycosyltransferase [Candidatus Parcubacteria bacterium]
MRVLFLYTGHRKELLEKAQKGEDPGGGLWGLWPLKQRGVQAELLELEQFFPIRIARFLRARVLGHYNAHLPLLPFLFRYDIVFTAGAFTTQIVFTVLQQLFRFKRPVWVMHDFSIIGLLGEGKTLKQKVFAWAVARTGGIVTVGKKESEALKSRFAHLASRIAYIPFGVDTEWFKPQPHVPEERLVITVGIDPDRDWPAFFEAVKDIDAKVIVAGSGRRSKRFNPPPSVEVRMFTPKEMVDLYARAAVVVIPLDTSSRVNDAMGLSTLYEAMAMGKAIVVSHTDHTESYIQNSENGMLVPQKDAGAMRRAVLELLENRDKRVQLGKSARAYAERELAYEKTGKDLIAFFEQLR